MSWQLVSESNVLETKDNEAGTGTLERTVNTIVRKQSITAYESPSESGTLSGVLTFYWNASLQSRSLANPKKYKCISDQVERQEIPGNGGERIQVWVYISAWTAASFS